MAGSATYELKILLSLQDKASHGLSNFERRLRALDNSVKSHTGTLGRLSSLQENLIDPARRIGDVWHRQVDSLRVYTDAAMKLSAAEARFRAIGLSQEQNARAFEAVRRQVASMQGVSLADTTENLLDVTNALGELNQAVTALPTASRYQFTMRALFGDAMTAGQVNENVRSAFKLLELTGHTQRGPQDMEKMLDTITRIGASTGGRITPNELLLMARRGSPAVQGMSETGLRNISSLIEDMGAPQTGTAMMSLYQTLVAGIMKQSAMERFDYFGLLDRSKIQFGRAQKIKRLEPGANLLGPLLQEDPLKAADLLVQKFKEKGIDTTDERAVQRELSVLFGNRNSFRLMNMLITQRAQIAKESERARTAMGTESLYKTADESPMGKMLKYQATMENFRTTVGIPMLEVGSKLMTHALPFFQWLAEHPYWAASLIVGAKGLSAMAETAAILKMSGLSDWFSGSAKGANRLAEATATVSRQAGFMSRDLSSAGMAAAEADRNAAGLSRRFSALGALKFAGTVAAIGGISLAIFDTIERTRELNDLFQKNTEEARATYDYLVATGQLYTNKPAPDTQVDALIKRLNEKGELSGALREQPSVFTAPEKFIPFMGEKHAIYPDEYMKGGLIDFIQPRPYQGRLNNWLNFLSPRSSGRTVDDATAVDRMRKLIPEAGDPHVMAGIIKSVRGGALGPEVGQAGISEFMRLLGNAFGDNTFKQAMELAGQSASDLAEQTLKSSQAMKDLFDPVNRLAPATGRAGLALDDFAVRLGNFELPHLGPIVETGSGRGGTTGGSVTVPSTGSPTLNRFFSNPQPARSPAKRAHASMRAPLEPQLPRALVPPSYNARNDRQAYRDRPTERADVRGDVHHVRKNYTFSITESSNARATAREIKRMLERDEERS